MRLLAACSLGGAGHLQPLVPFLDAARRRGDEVLVVAPPAMCDMVRGTGHPFRAGGEPAEAEVAAIREQLPVAPRQEASILGNRELFGRLATTAMLPHMEQVFAEWAPDLVLRDPCEYASAVIAHRLGTPAAQVAVSVAEGEWNSIAVAQPALEEHRAGLTDELRASPYLTRFPASLDPSPFADTIRFREHRAVATSPLPDWWDRSDAPLVYLTFGTVLGHMTLAGDTYRTALAAVASSATRVLLTVGRRFDTTSIGVTPSNVHVEPWVDQQSVFAEAALVVCHGGSGTAFGALAAGLPLVLVPLFADQFENSRRISAVGAGLVVDRRDDPARIREAIETVLAEPAYREGAQRIADEMASAPAVDEVLASLATR
jgi:UDP:flavonoid glycosyltransferase YjiC (YdhE family)